MHRKRDLIEVYARRAWWEGFLLGLLIPTIALAVWLGNCHP